MRADGKWADAPRERSQSASKAVNHDDVPSSRASSLGAAVGFLLNRARQQKMTSMSSKRSRSSSTVRQRSAPEERHPQSNPRGPPSSMREVSRGSRDCSRGRGGEPPRKVGRKESKDGASYFSGLASISLAEHMLPTSCVSSHANSSASVATRVHPIWVLVGTFKTSLDSVVRVSGGSLQWHQRTPKGGFQSMQVAISLITDVSCARIAVSRDESTYSVIIKTAGKPSQVTFGFVRCSDAVSFKGSIAQIIRTTSAS